MLKESFILYTPFYEPIKGLSLEEKGLLLEAIFEYQINGTEKKLTSQVKMAFEFFKNQFRLDEEKYNKIIERNKTNGAKGGRPKTQKNPKNPVGLKEPKKPYTDTDTDTDTEKDKDNKKDFDFIENTEWKELFIQYIDYRKKIKKALNPVSYQSAYDKLLKLSKSNLISAREIVGNSIASGWQGLFKIDDKVSKSTNKQTRLEKNIDIIKNCEL